MRDWSLGHLTVAGATPGELVEIAARSGYAAVDPIVGLVSVEGLPVVPLKAGDPETRKLGQALKAHGLVFNAADGFVLDAHTDLVSVERMINLVAELGARSVNTMSFDPDASRRIANLAALNEMAAAAGLTVLLEFMMISQVPTVQAAQEVVDEIGGSNMRLMVDTLHLGFAGGGVEDVGRHLSAIGGVQICDAPANLTFEEYGRMTIEERLAPGDGVLPIAEIMAVLPPDLIIAIEMPRRDEPDLVARAKRGLDAGRALDRH